MIESGRPQIAAFDPETGELHWISTLDLAPQPGDGLESVDLPDEYEAGKWVWDQESRSMVPNLEEIRKAAWDRLKAVRYQKMAVAPTPWGEFDADEVGKANITGMATSLMLMGDQAPETIAWRIHDNTTATLTRDEFFNASLLVSQHVASIYAQSWALQEQINAAETIEDIEAVQWPDA